MVTIDFQHILLAARQLPKPSQAQLVAALLQEKGAAHTPLNKRTCPHWLALWGPASCAHRAGATGSGPAVRAPLAAGTAECPRPSGRARRA